MGTKDIKVFTPRRIKNAKNMKSMVTYRIKYEMGYEFKASYNRINY
jgi:hypothetical protein